MCSENKGADQLRCYCEADLRLFSHMQIVGFLMMRLISLFNFPIICLYPGLTRIYRDEAGDFVVPNVLHQKKTNYGQSN